MLQTSNYSLVLLVQLALLTYDLFVNSFSELLRAAPVVQLVLFIIQDIAILFNVIIVLLMLFNTYVFQVGLVSLLLERFRALLVISGLYLALSIALHCWILVLRRTGVSVLAITASMATVSQVRLIQHKSTKLLGMSLE